MFLAYLDGRITEPSFSTTGGNCRARSELGSSQIKSSVLSPFNFNLFNDIQEELFDTQASMRETTADKQHEEESKQK